GKMREKLREEGMFAAIIGMALRAASALCLVVGLLSAPARAETLDELYTKAKTEKSLVIYAGGPVSNYEPLAREFESKFPGRTVWIEGGFSNVLNQKMERQFSDQRLEADMVLFQTAQDFVRWKGQGKMLAFNRQVVQGSRRRVHRLVRGHALICLQYAAAETGECSEIRARFPQGGIPRQDDRVLSA